MPKFVLKHPIFLIFGSAVIGQMNYLKWLHEVLEQLSIDAKILVDEQPFRDEILKAEVADDGCYNERRAQVETNCLLVRISDLRREMARETKKFPLIVYVTNHDLYSKKPRTNFIFGITEGMAATIFSPTRFEISRLWNKKRATKYIFQHEIGHLFGAPSDLREDLDKKLEVHCPVNGCVMQQSLSVKEASSKSKKIKKGLFCPSCKTDTESYLSHILLREIVEIR